MPLHGLTDLAVYKGLAVPFHGLKDLAVPIQGLEHFLPRGRYKVFSSAFPAQQRGRYKALAVPLKDLALQNYMGTCYKHVLNMFQTGCMLSTCYSYQGLSSAFTGTSRT